MPASPNFRPYSGAARHLLRQHPRQLKLELVDDHPEAAIPEITDMARQQMEVSVRRLEGRQRRKRSRGTPSWWTFDAPVEVSAR